MKSKGTKGSRTREDLRSEDEVVVGTSHLPMAGKLYRKIIAMAMARYRNRLPMCPAVQESLLRLN